MMHPLDRPIGTDLGFESFQKRARLGQLGVPELDSQNRRLYSLPSVVVQRERYLADRDTVLDGFQGDAGLWRHGRKGQR